MKLLQWRSSYSQVITSFLTTFSTKINSVAVEKYFLFIQNIFSSQLKNHTATAIHFFMLKVVRKEVITCEYEERHYSNFI